MKVLDLFSGLKGWSEPFKDRGHETFTIDWLEKFEPDLVINILDLDPQKHLPWKPDVILASPPCDAFSVLRIGRNWTVDHKPKTKQALNGYLLLEKTVKLIEEINPKYFVIENPRGKMRRMPILDKFERRTVTYCQYGEKRMKPTDLWGGFHPNLVLKAACKNGDPCHIRAPRGSVTGTQGMDPALAGKIPYALALDICKSMPL